MVSWLERKKYYNCSNITQHDIDILWNVFSNYVQYGSICRPKFLGQNTYTEPIIYIKGSWLQQPKDQFTI